MALATGTITSLLPSAPLVNLEHIPIDDFNPSEWRTRKQRIDGLLRDQGWQIACYRASRPIPPTGCVTVEESETSSGPADYALCVEGQFLGIVERGAIAQGNALGKLETTSPYSPGTGTA